MLPSITSQPCIALHLPKMEILNLPFQALLSIGILKIAAFVNFFFKLVHSSGMTDYH